MKGQKKNHWRIETGRNFKNFNPITPNFIPLSFVGKGHLDLI